MKYLTLSKNKAIFVSTAGQNRPCMGFSNELSVVTLLCNGEFDFSVDHQDGRSLHSCCHILKLLQLGPRRRRNHQIAARRERYLRGLTLPSECNPNLIQHTNCYVPQQSKNSVEITPVKNLVLCEVCWNMDMPMSM